MNVKDTREVLEQVWNGEAPLRSLLGLTYEGHFGGYHLAGVVTELRKQNDCILINWKIGAPYLRYVQATGVKFEGMSGSSPILSLDFTLEYPRDITIPS